MMNHGVLSGVVESYHANSWVVRVPCFSRDHIFGEHNIGPWQIAPSLRGILTVGMKVRMVYVQGPSVRGWHVMGEVE